MTSGAEYRHVLRGCSPEPLIAYLKALGVLRLFATQRDGQARGAWSGDAFVLVTACDREDVERFFLDEYRPTPMLAPWNKGSGFWDNTENGKAVQTLRSSTSPRLQRYREVLEAIDQILAREGWTGEAADKMKESQKLRLVRVLRNHVPEDVLEWLDATAVLTLDQLRFAPVLGTGSNDGRLDFTPNFIRHLMRVIPFGADDAPAPAKRGRRPAAEYDRSQSLMWLSQSLFREGNPALLAATGGQYHPGATGGPNASGAGFEGEALINPWDFILMMEGTLVLAAAVARRMGSEGAGSYARFAAFPFSASVSAAGLDTMAFADAKLRRRKMSKRDQVELWMPLWRSEVSLSELQALFAEGRAQVGRRQAASGVEFAVAVSTLGMDRGIKEFQRFGLLERNGQAFIAVPLDRIVVRERSGARLIEEIQPWLHNVRRQGESHASVEPALARVDRAIFRFTRGGSPTDMLHVLAGLGRLERVLSRLPKLHAYLQPLTLAENWLDATDDGSPEHRLASSVVTTAWTGFRTFREWLEPVRTGRMSVRWEASREGRWSGPGLVSNLQSLLWHLVTTSNKEDEAQPIAAGMGAARRRAPATSISAFLAGTVDDNLLEDLIWGMACVRPGQSPGGVRPAHHGRRGVIPGSRGVWLPTEYLLLKLLFLEESIPVPGLDGETIKPTPDASVLASLRAGKVDRAVATAVRRLKAVGLVPIGAETGVTEFAADFHRTESQRLAAALIFPLEAAAAWSRSVLHINKNVEAKEATMTS